LSRPRVYLETSFISYLAAARQQRHSSDVNTAHRQLTSLRWWTQHRGQFELFISEVVSKESATGHPEAVRNRLQLLAFAQILPEVSEIMELAKRLVEPIGPLPRKADADATHIAFASVYECDYLLTWNFKHIANALLQPALYRIVQSYGYQPPILCTPEQLLAGDRDL
jgi:predicted nucleic acid-binding protein